VGRSKIRRLTVAGKTDGFGAQLNAKLSGIAFGFCHPGWRYVHRPFTRVSHGVKHTDCNWLFPHPYGRHTFHVNLWNGVRHVFNRPHEWYKPKVLEHIRSIYWSNKEFEQSEEIAVHIRRGDIAAHKRHRHSEGKRWQSNKYYNSIIPKIAANYSDSMPVVIYSEGKESEFLSGPNPINKNWGNALSERLSLRLGKYRDNKPDDENNYMGLIEAYQKMTSSKVFVQSRSSLSWCVSLMNENDIWLQPTTRRHYSYRGRLEHWNII